jgi:hypothetical protein
MPNVKSTISCKAQSLRAVGRLGAALTLAVLLCLISPSPASAQDPSEYFELSYEPVVFDKSEINGGEVFHTTIKGSLTCNKALPVSVSEVTVVSEVVAEHASGDVWVTLNPNYTLTINPFPAKEGETAEIIQSVPLQFPSQAISGDYNVIGKIVEVKAKVLFAWVDATGYLPKEQHMGTVKYTAPEATTSPAPAPAPASSLKEPPAPPVPENPPEAEPEPGPPPLKSTPSGTNTPAPQEEPEPIFTWWVEVIVFIAVATTIFNIVWFLSHRHD